jgi:predicted transcriptional regulator
LEQLNHSDPVEASLWTDFDHSKEETTKISMNTNPTFSSNEPLNALLRRRRLELNLLQADLAEALDVSPECITLWEAGRRRMELAKIPRIAAALQIDPKELCNKALSEFHPAFYATLFGHCGARNQDA